MAPPTRHHARHSRRRRRIVSACGQWLLAILAQVLVQLLLRLITHWLSLPASGGD